MAIKRKITALSAQKRNPQRVNVYLDGEFAFALARIVAAWLQVGQEIDDEKIAQLTTQDSYENAHQRALNFLSYRPRSAEEIRQNLREHQTTEQVIEHVLERLVQSNLVNDSAFAQAWVDNRSALRPRSKRALAFELQRHGVDSQIIEQSLETVNDEQLAYQAACSRARRLQSLEWKEFRQKLTQYLLQRGFGYEEVAQVTQRIWNEIHHMEEEGT
jgi:regulatory protein